MADASSPSSSDHIDRLSNLPEHIHLHILSFLPTKMAAKTSFLSKPWQHLWTLVPAIDLCDNGLSEYDSSSNDDGSSYDGFSFEHSVSKVLESNKSPVIRRFFLRGKDCTTSSLDKWLSAAAERQVEELDLAIDFLYDDVLPSQSYSSPSTIAIWSATKSFKTLVVMKLEMGSLFDNSLFVINIGENLECYFPTLKVLYLSNVWFEGGDPSLSGNFASRFPLLEDLVIGMTKFHHDVNISLPKLRRFEIDCACLESLRELRLNMDTPSLQCLVLHCLRCENLHNLLDASLSSRFPLLQELVINRATFRHDINISLPKLTSLEIDYARSRPLRKYTLNIKAPSLRYLDISRFESLGFRVEALPNLVEASVDVDYKMRDDKYYYEYGESLINFINELFNVRRLNLSRATMWELRNASSCSFFDANEIQPFHNLVELDLHLHGSFLDIMFIMLSKFENLEHLKITNYRSECKEYSLASPTYVPNCLTYHLKTFCFQKFECSKYEMELTIYILKNSLVLENTKIIFGCGQGKKAHQSETILSTSSRGSVECQLEFDQDATGYDYDSD